MNNKPEYFAENELDDGDIKAGIDDGTIEPWRVEPNGRQWYRRIKAIPATAAARKKTGLLGTIKKKILGIPNDSAATASDHTGVIHGTPSDTSVRISK